MIQMYRNGSSLQRLICLVENTLRRFQKDWGRKISVHLQKSHLARCSHLAHALKATSASCIIQDLTSTNAPYRSGQLFSPKLHCDSCEMKRNNKSSNGRSKEEGGP